MNRSIPILHIHDRNQACARGCDAFTGARSLRLVLDSSRDSRKVYPGPCVVAPRVSSAPTTPGSWQGSCTRAMEGDEDMLHDRARSGGAMGMAMDVKNEAASRRQGDNLSHDTDDVDSGNGKLTENGSLPKIRRRNIEKHLAAERDRRKATKNKALELDDLLPPSKAGPRTLNQSLAAAIAHIRWILQTGGAETGRGGEDGRDPNPRNVSLPQVMASSPTVGCAVLDRDWKFIQVNSTLEHLLIDNPLMAQSIRGMGLLSFIHPPDVSALADLLSRLSCSTSTGGDKVFLNLRFQTISRMPILDGYVRGCRVRFFVVWVGAQLATSTLQD
jgi:hypothetical protein